MTQLRLPRGLDYEYMVCDLTLPKLQLVALPNNAAVGRLDDSYIFTVKSKHNLTHKIHSNCKDMFNACILCPSPTILFPPRYQPNPDNPFREPDLPCSLR